MAHQPDTVLITGAAQRVGACLARTFHKAGYNVIIHYFQSQDSAIKLSEEFNDIRKQSAFLCQGDLSDTASIKAQVLSITDNLSVLINNASSFYPTPIKEFNKEHWDDLFTSNAKAPLFLTQALLPLLTTSQRTKTGCVINLVDIHAQRPLKDHTIYCMAKAANQMMTMSLAKELAPNVRVNGIAPGAILWPSQSNEISEEYKKDTLDKIPANKLGNAADIAETALFLATGPEYITGQIISVDGGRTLYS